MTMTTKRPYADPTSKRRSVTVNEADWQALKKLGSGNASAGIRKALNDARLHENIVRAMREPTNHVGSTK